MPYKACFGLKLHEGTRHGCALVRRSCGEEKMHAAVTGKRAGMRLTAAIVGSGELIAATRSGAEAGSVLLWVIIFSCLVNLMVTRIAGAIRSRQRSGVTVIRVAVRVQEMLWIRPVITRWKLSIQYPERQRSRA
jgi:hypothetical protein